MEYGAYEDQYHTGNISWYHQGRLSIILAVIELFTDGKTDLDILDIGCGTGLLMEKLESKGKVDGIDFSPEALQFCRNRGLTTLYQGTLPSDMPPITKLYDLITCIEVLEHIEDDLQAVKVIHERLKPEGLLVVTVPAYDILWGRHDLFCHHVRRYNKKRILKLMEESGFKVIKLSYFTIFMFFPILVFRVLYRQFFQLKPKNENFLPPEPVNTFLKRLFQFERHIVRRCNFPFGSGILVVCCKNVANELAG